MAKGGMTYERAGVSQRLGDNVSDIMANACRLTYNFPIIGKVVYSDGDKPYFDYGETPVRQSSSDTDGVGTKIEVAERVDDHTTIYHDLIAMLADDVSMLGGIPVYATNIVDWNHPNKRISRQLMVGMVEACERARIAMLGGENAELGNRINGYGKFNYNVGGAVAWVRPGEPIDGKNIQEGDEIVALLETGFRSNGFTLIRELADKYLGKEWHKARHGKRTWGREVLEPSNIYSGAWVDMLYDSSLEPRDDVGVKMIAHNTGGGIPGKLGKPLAKLGFGANLDKLWTPCDAMLELQEIGKTYGDQVTDKAAYKAWNMGNGGFVVADDPDAVIEIAGRHGIKAKKCGKIRKKTGITLVSQGRWREGKTISV